MQAAEPIRRISAAIFDVDGASRGRHSTTN
jgi:hypothetical protein